MSAPPSSVRPRGVDACANPATFPHSNWRQYHFSFRPIIPRDVWRSITHVLVTHADPDHHWHTDRLVAESDATVICGAGMTQGRDGERFMRGPRSRGLAFTYSPSNLVTVDTGEAVGVAAMRVTGLAAEHGPLSFRFGPIRKTLHPGPKERIGYGATGFSLEIEDKLIVNLGDTLKLLDDWTGVPRPDVLMIPIGGDEVGNAMGIRDAIEVVEALRPRLAIPCHHNLPSFFVTIQLFSIIYPLAKACGRTRPEALQSRSCDAFSLSIYNFV